MRSYIGILDLQLIGGAWQLSGADEPARSLLQMPAGDTWAGLADRIEFIGIPSNFNDWLEGRAAAVGTTQFARIRPCATAAADVQFALTLAAIADREATIWLRLMPAAEVVQVAALNSPIAVLLVEDNLRVRWANLATVRNFGQPLGRLIGRSIHEFSPEAASRSTMHEQMLRGELETLEVPVTPVSIDGGPVRYAKAHLQVLRHPDGVVDCLAVYFEDITDRILSERELRAGNTRYSALTRHVRDLVTVCDARGNTILPTAAIETLLGYTVEERIGKPVLDLVHPDDRDRAYQRFSDIVRDPEASKPPLLEVRLCHRDGTWIDVEYTATNMLDDPDVRGIVLVGRIITRRKEFERRLQRAKDALELAIDGVHASFWEYDVATGLVTAAASVSQDDADTEVVRRAPPAWSLERIHPADRAQFDRTVRATIEGHQLLLDTELRVSGDSGWTWLLLRGRLAAPAEPDGSPRLTGMSVDVTNLKSAQAAAANDRLKLELALGAARIGTWEFAVAEGQLTLDDLAARLAHHARAVAPMTAPAWLQRVHSDDRQTVEKWIASFGAGATFVQDCEYRHVGDDGIARRLLLRGYVANEQALGPVTKVAGILLEIDALRSAELRLRETEDKFATALWAAQVGYWTVDLAQDRAEMSPEYFELTGIDPAHWHADKHPWTSRIHPDDWPRFVSWHRKCMQGRTLHYESEYRLRTPAGWIWVSDRGRVVARDAEGRPTVLAGTTVNISPRKELEEQLLSAATLEQRRLSQDLHDGLGQELAGIAYLLSSLSTRIRREYRAVASDVEHLNVLMRQAIASARSIAHGLLPASLVSHGLRQAVRELCAGTAATYGVQIDCAAGEWDPGSVPDDAAQHIYRIVQEALNNARRHGRASIIGVTMGLEQEHLCVSVVDNGQGLPREPPPDAGFGLRIMATRAQSMGADLDVGDAPGGGTRVWLRCPTLVRGGDYPAYQSQGAQLGIFDGA